MIGPPRGGRQTGYVFKWRSAFSRAQNSLPRPAHYFEGIRRRCRETRLVPDRVNRVDHPSGGSLPYSAG